MSDEQFEGATAYLPSWHGGYRLRRVLYETANYGRVMVVLPLGVEPPCEHFVVDAVAALMVRPAEIH